MWLVQAQTALLFLGPNLSNWAAGYGTNGVCDDSDCDDDDDDDDDADGPAARERTFPGATLSASASLGFVKGPVKT